MNREEIIYHLEHLIKEYKYECSVLEDMLECWEQHDDPGSDPGLQYEQEMVIDEKWNKIQSFCKEKL
jgi:hypothetical protein